MAEALEVLESKKRAAMAKSAQAETWVIHDYWSDLSYGPGCDDYVKGDREGTEPHRPSLKDLNGGNSSIMTSGDEQSDADLEVMKYFLRL